MTADQSNCVNITRGTLFIPNYHINQTKNPTLVYKRKHNVITQKKNNARQPTVKLLLPSKTRSTNASGIVVQFNRVILTNPYVGFYT